MYASGQYIYIYIMDVMHCNIFEYSYLLLWNWIKGKNENNIYLYHTINSIDDQLLKDIWYEIVGKISILPIPKKEFLHKLFGFCLVSENLWLVLH